MRIAPPLTATEEHVEEAHDNLDQAFARVQDAAERRLPKVWMNEQETRQDLFSHCKRPAHFRGSQD